MAQQTFDDARALLHDPEERAAADSVLSVLDKMMARYAVLLELLAPAAEDSTRKYLAYSEGDLATSPSVDGWPATAPEHTAIALPHSTLQRPPARTPRVPASTDHTPLRYRNDARPPLFRLE